MKKKILKAKIKGLKKDFEIIEKDYEELNNAYRISVTKSRIKYHNNLFNRRKDLNLTIRMVADYSDISPSTISRMECGKDVMYSTVVTLSDLYDKKEVELALVKKNQALEYSGSHLKSNNMYLCGFCDEYRDHTEIGNDLKCLHCGFIATE